MQGPSEDAHVLRFSPYSAEGVLKSARRESLVREHFGVSVWAANAQDGETVADVVRRLLALARLSGISDPSRYALCTPAGELAERGFRFVKDQYDGEEPEHYCVVLGDDPDRDDAQRFLDAFERQRWKEDTDAA